jgi:hypothetical protein
MISYGIYLWQSVGFELLRDAGLRDSLANPTIWWLPLGFGAAILAGALS